MGTGILQDQAIVVTGAGRGIGREVAHLLAKEGAQVVVNDPGVALDGQGDSQAPADTVVNEIRQQGGQAVASYASVATMAGGEAIIQSSLDAFGRLDGVVTCAGIIRDRMVFNMSEAEWDAVIAVHLKGTFSVVRRACQIFHKQQHGRIVTFSSESGLLGNPGQANYGAAKAGIAGFTRSVAVDMRGYGVTANCVAPRALTRMTSAVAGQLAEYVRQQGLENDEDAALEKQPPDGIAPFVAFLLSDHAANISGQTFLVYGNTVAHLALPRTVYAVYNGKPSWQLADVAPVLSAAFKTPLVPGIVAAPAKP